MKRRTMILMLAALALFTQCKKQEANEQGNGNGIQMVLKADNGGSKTSFGANGSISWNTNEKIFVVTNGQCVGYVTNGTEGGSTFTGTLTGIDESGTYDFHYYYVGNTQTIATGADSFTMDFFNQDGTLANLGNFHVGYGVQNTVEVTVSETVTTQASMRSLVAMAYFNTAGMAEAGEAVAFYGDNINNQMSIAFSGESANTPVFSKVNGGRICATASSGAYVMLLPNHTDGTELLDTDITFVSKRTTGSCNDVFNYGIIGGRFYCNEGNTESPILVTAASYDPGSLRGEFSVSETKTVRFSQGNLQYIGSAAAPYWKFAVHQWDYLGDNGQGSDSPTVDRDLFGWGTSGYNHGALYYQPWSTDLSYEGYNPYNSYSTNLYDSNGQADWGYNAIANGGNTENQWRTLTKDEWVYIFNTRTNAASKWGHGNVNGVNGMILLPDDWTLPEGLSFTSGNSSWDNVYTTEQWAQMEYNGAVFLPRAGIRAVTDLYIDRGQYWSSSLYDDYIAYSVYFSGAYLDADDRTYCFGGCSVRLVHNMQ